MTLEKRRMLLHVCSILFLSTWQMLCTFAQDSIDHYKIADQLYENNLRDSAIWHVNKTIAQASSQKDDSLLILGLTLKCQIYMAVRTLDEANSIINEALPIADLLPTSKRHLAWMAYRQKAQMMNTMFRFDSTIFYLEAAQANIPGPDDNPGFSHSLYAWAYVNKREYDKAIIHSKRSYDLYSTHADSQSVSLIIPLQCLQASYNYSSQFDSALIYAKIYQRLVAKHYAPNHPNIGIAHNDLGTIYQNLRRYPDALYHRKKCEDIFYHDYLENKQTRLISHAWHNLGYLYNQMGDNHLAYNYLEKAFKLNEQDYGRESLTHINTLLHLGHIKTNSKEYHSGEILIRRALAMQKKLGPDDSGALNLIQGNLASNLYHQSRFLQSDSLFIQLSKYYQQTGSFYTKQMLGVHDGWGHSWALRDDHRQAMKHFEIALSIADSIYPPLNLETIRIFSKMARSSAFVSEADSKIYQDKILQILASSPNDSPTIRFAIPNAVIPELAITRLIILKQKQQKGLSIRAELLQLIDDYMFYVARHLGMFSSDISIQDFSSTNKQIFIQASELLLNESHSAEDLYTTFRWGDAFRSLTLKIQANGIVDTPQSGQIPRWQSLEDSLVAQLRTARVRYHQSPTQDVEALRELAANIESYQLLKKQLRIENPQLYQKKYALSQIPQKRDESVVIKHRDVIQFSSTDSILHVHISNKDGIHHFSTQILLPKDLITEYLALDNSTQNVAAINQLLTDSIIRPLQKYARTDKWIIIPDGDLTYLNLEQIKDGSGNYLIDNIEISYAYSFSQIIQQKKSSEKQSNLIGSFAPGFSNLLKQGYLRDSFSEIDSSFLQYLQQPFMLALAADLQQQYEGRAYLDAEATESNLKHSMHRFNILNLGTHGEIDDSNPLYSRIVLAKEALDSVAEDGYLHTYEIYGLDIPAELAILSACETGSGMIKDGEGVISLAHAFQYAGCPSVVMSLWKIDEKSSAIILKHFYTYLAKKWDKSAALRRAKLDYIQDAPQALKAPYYWAGLVLIGDPRPIHLDGTGYNMWLLTIAVISMLYLLWFLASRQSRSGFS